MNKVKNLWTKFSNALNTASVEKTKSNSKGVKTFYGALAALSVLTLTMKPIYAVDAMQTQIKSTMKQVYGIIFTISTSIWVVILAVGFLMRMISKNPRAIEEATSWMKRASIAWLCINALGLIVSFGQDFAKNLGGDTINW